MKDLENPGREGQSRQPAASSSKAHKRRRGNEDQQGLERLQRRHVWTTYVHIPGRDLAGTWQWPLELAAQAHRLVQGNKPQMVTPLNLDPGETRRADGQWLEARRMTRGESGLSQTGYREALLAKAHGTHEGLHRGGICTHLFKPSPEQGPTAPPPCVEVKLFRHQTLPSSVGWEQSHDRTGIFPPRHSLQ